MSVVYQAADAVDFQQIRRVLVVKLRHHGDVLLSSPVFQILKARYPHLEIDALVYHDTREMLSEHPAIHQLHTIDRAWKKQGVKAQLGHELALLKTLKAQKYDLLIHLTESNRGALLARYLKPRYAVVRRYATRRSRFWKNSFSHHYSSPGGGRRHTVEMHLDALRRLGLQPSQQERRLVLEAGEVARQRVKTLLLEQGVEGDYIHIHPASRWLFKCWPEEAFARLLDDLQKHQLPLVLSAAPSEHELEMVKDICEQTNSRPISLAGQLSLKELSALVEGARLFVGVDSVPMHIAAALQTPTVALFGPSGDKEWGPWMVPHRIMTSDHSCRPCGQDGCGNGKVSDCLVRIGAADVAAACDELLS